jgi:beta-lactamase regulating signal transducer with metallopeptidase domain
MKIAIVLSLGLLIVALMRRQAAAMRHWTLAVTIACAAGVPAIGAVAPTWQWPAAAVPDRGAGAVAVDVAFAIDPGSAAPVRAHARDEDAHGVTSAGIGPWLTRIRWVGAVLGMIGLLTGLTRLGTIVRHATPVTSGRLWDRWTDAQAELGITRPVRLLQSDTRPLLMTWGLLRPTVIVPVMAADWTDARLRAVLLHELAHVQRGDWPALMIAELLRAVDWLNPLTWIAARRLRAESELACDDLVLSSGLPAHEYAAHLLAMARLVGEDHRRAAQAMARPSGIERRVEAMLNRHVNRIPGTRLRRTAVAGALACATVAIAGYGLAAQGLTSVSGVVYDPMNLGVPRATISLTETRTEARHEVKSDPTGRFELAGLTPGDYQLEVRVAGFEPARASVTVSGRHVDADINLRLGSLQETITLRRDAAGTTPERPLVRTAPQPVSAPACERTGSGGNIQQPLKVRNVPPIYPDTAAPVEGIVVVDARIGTDGTVVSAVAREPANPDLASAAVAAIEQWRFTPTLLNCVPVEVAMTASFRFSTEG